MSTHSEGLAFEPEPASDGRLVRTERSRRALEIMADEVRRGLLRRPLPELPCKYFYDERGSALFERITELPEYYQTRTETAILERRAAELVEAVAPRELVELGSGSGRKIRLLLDAMRASGRLESVLLLEIAEAALRDSVARLQADYPGASVRGITGDFVHDLDALGPGGGRLLLLLAGTIGNLHPRQLPRFFRAAARALEPGDAFLVGVDLVKDPSRLRAAYNDSAGVTAEFNRNILRVVNERLGADFDPGDFDHVAFYDPRHEWIEMRLRARRSLRACIPGAGLELSLSGGADIRTELSCKYTLESFGSRLAHSGLELERWITDPEGLFGAALLRRSGERGPARAGGAGRERPPRTRSRTSRATIEEASLQRLQQAWERSDRLFSILREDAWLEQPIALRQPFLFYLGHLPAFAWNHVGRGALREPPILADFDQLFERGIDPVGVDRYTPRAAWPERPAVLDYRDRVRERLQEALSRHALPLDAESVVAMVVEHELMHHETLLYMVQELDHGSKLRPAGWPALPQGASPGPARAVEIAASEALLGARPGSLAFGWDNEFPEQRVQVPAFGIDDRPVTNADLLEFVRDGGYREPRLWREEDWAWRARVGLDHPHSWRTASRLGANGLRDQAVGGGLLRVRSLLEDVPFERAAGWPAAVSWAEAAAYARWRGARLPTEAEWHRARSAETSDATETANLDFRHGSPLPVGSDPQPVGSNANGSRASRVRELVGNGWEWTSTPFGPYPGFEPMRRYPGYSADFFDGAHFVLLGGSWATDRALVRRSFRNWFQPHYPYVFSKLRCVRPLSGS